MKKSIFIFLLLIINCSILNAQQYYPLKVGNKFVYSFVHSQYPNPHTYYWIRINSITKDTIINGKKYYFATFLPFESSDTNWVRVDSLTGSLYVYNPSNNCHYYYYEKLVDSLSMTSGNQGNCSYLNTGFYSGTNTLFGYQTFYKQFRFNWSQGGASELQYRYYSNKFGMYFIEYSTGGYGSGYSEDGNLVGCIINDTLYGDTSSTAVRTKYEIVPEKFFLFQNYPNPFNPFTTIKFNILKSSNVILKVFDITGKEISTLINEKLQPGTYETQWNANEFSSGVYFYRIEAGNFRETKKMLMIK